MIKCSDTCKPCCDFCIHAIHDEFEWNGVQITGEPIGCSLWDDEKHQELAESCSYCNDFHCMNVKRE